MKMSIIKHKSRLQMEIKEVSEDGTFEGLLSPYGNIDAGGDVVEPGAFAKSLKERGNVVTLLWQHKTEFPIGTLTLEDRKDGLWCKGQLQMELQKAKEAHICLKNRIIKGLSIGFETIKDSIENGVRHLKEIRLWEGSVVTFAMNELAMVMSIKARNGIKGDFVEELSEIQTLSGYWQMQEALGNALRSLIWANMTKDEKVALCNSILQQFIEAFSSFFPDYLDALTEAYGPSENWASRTKLEIKAGAMISSSNADKLTSACEKIKCGHDDILALLGDDKAGATTLSTKAAETKTEPDTHSAAETTDTAEVNDLIAGIRALIPA
jgi:HK97 family phage prohead protease